jgi:hypothetical protein
MRTCRKVPLTGLSFRLLPFRIVGPEIAPPQPLGVASTPVIVTGMEAQLWIATVTTYAPPRCQA